MNNQFLGQKQLTNSPMNYTNFGSGGNMSTKPTDNAYEKTPRHLSQTDALCTPLESVSLPLFDNSVNYRELLWNQYFQNEISMETILKLTNDIKHVIA